MMLRHLDVYQAVRNVSRVFAKIGSIPIRERPCFPVGDIAHCLVEISADDKRPGPPMEKPCQNCTEVLRNREVKSCNQPKYVTECCKKNDEGSVFSHKFDFNFPPSPCEGRSRAWASIRFDAPGGRDLSG